MLGTGEVRHPRLDRAGRRPDRIGAQQVGYRDAGGTLQYAGAKGTDFYDKELTALHRRFQSMAMAEPPPGLMVAGDPVDSTG